jgi:hypothetical protein
VYGKALEDLRLDLASGLDLEQRYIALLDDGADLAQLRSQGKLDDAVRGVPAARVRKGIEDRLKRLSDECVLLAHVDATRRDDPTVVPADVFFAGLHPRFATDEEVALANVLRSVVSRVNLVTGWEERDSLVLYRALLGVPVYWFKNVQSVLYPAYRKVREDAHRTYPLQIEAVWEAPPGLPDLDPVELKRAQERREKEQAAAAAKAALDARMRAFTLCAHTGAITRDEGGYAWTMAGVKNRLGADRSSAYAAFQALDPVLRSDLEQGALNTFAAARADRAGRARMAAELRAHGDRLKEAYARAIAEQKDAERSHVQEERRVVETLVSELEGSPAAGA